MDEKELKEKKEKNQNKFVKLLKNIFVHNIGWKILSLVAAGVIWVLAIGLL